LFRGGKKLNEGVSEGLTSEGVTLSHTLT
jgi:hypothetical protein